MDEASPESALSVLTERWIASSSSVAAPTAAP
jgi:hypothetical protein